MGFVIIMTVNKHCKYSLMILTDFFSSSMTVDEIPLCAEVISIVRLCCHIALATIMINQDCFYKMYPGDFEAKERAQNLSFTEVAVKSKIYFHGAIIIIIFLRFRVLIKFIELSFKMAWAYWREALSFQGKHLP